MRTNKFLNFILLIFIGVCLTPASLLPQTASASASNADCSRASYTRCVSLADPLLKDSALIFPDNMRDIELVCLTWNSFVDCLKAYTDRCFTNEQRRQFNKAVENPIESVHMMCTQQHYQKEYLEHASCIKSTVTEQEHCGDQYAQLVEQVSQGEAISRNNLCCSHQKFRNCVMKEATRMCDRGIPHGNAVRFAEQIIDKALSFLQDQCYDYKLRPGDCISVSYKTLEDQLAMSTSPWFSTRGRDISRDISPSSSHSIQPDLSDPLSTDVTVLDLGAATNNEENNDGTLMSTPDASSRSRPSSSVGDVRVTDGGWSPSLPETEQDGDSSGAVLGSRTRPSSYGRSAGWDTSPSVGPTPSSRPDWATVSSWHVYSTRGSDSNIGPSISNNQYSANNQNNFGGYSGSPSTHLSSNPSNKDINSNFIHVTTTETWYPAAGSHVGNEVDEPNQLGLAKPKNSAPGGRQINAAKLCLIFVASVLVAYC